MTFDESRPFVSAEDFDATGILTGVDACASSYWWMPELYGPDAGPARIQVRLVENAAVQPERDQATRRTTSRTTAAA
ncbi:MAG: hypothetical protein ACK54F_03145 [Planctomycetia bacterium]|jgi:hypothetical protein